MTQAANTNHAREIREKTILMNTFY